MAPKIDSDQLDIAYCDSTKHFATFPGHAGSFKNQKNAFLNDPKSQERGFRPFSGHDGLDIAYYDSTNCFSTFGNGNRS